MNNTDVPIWEKYTLRVETSSLQEKIDLLNKEWEEAEENVRELQKKARTLPERKENLPRN